MKFYRYKDSLNVTIVSAKFANPDYGWQNFEWDLKRHPECETYLDFKTWLTFYNADIKGWYLIDRCIKGYQRRNIYLPYYYGTDKKCHFIKFINAHEYRKFKRWYRQHLREKDNEQNLQEQTELARMVRKAAAKHTEEAIKKQKQADEELQEIKDRIAAIANSSLYRVATNQNGPSVTFSTGQFRDETVPAKKKKK